MTAHLKLRFSIAALAFATVVPFASAQRTAKTANNMHWVATWGASEQQPRAAGPGRGGPAPQAAARAGNATAPAAAPAAPPAPPRAAPPPSAFNNQTVRMIVRTSLGGSRVRVHLSNAFGTAPLSVGAAHIALRSKDSAIVAGSDRPLAFHGKPSVTIPPGAEMISDPVSLDVPKLSDLAISVYVPGDTGAASAHSMALKTTYIQSGDSTSAAEMAEATTSQAWPWVSDVDVLAPAAAATIVAFGDSITDGATSTPNTNHSWPSLLAQRLAANPATANLAVVNQGISGNRVLGDGAGVSALARFDRDVLAQSGVKYLMILESINDINGGARQGTVTADALINALAQMVDRAHTHGIKVIGCTLTPYGNINDEGEVMRQAVNAWIRTPGNFDAMVDFDAVIRDPQDQKQFKQGYNNTDKLHPNDTGYQAMADAIDLKLFAQK
ncbi:MAG TPA: SGNH/GDSL hydrolase family protein [Bryobacteraceae bacterium]|jgi:lysophospholipase L1-like esterase